MMVIVREEEEVSVVLWELRRVVEIWRGELGRGRVGPVEDGRGRGRGASGELFERGVKGGGGRGGGS